MSAQLEELGIIHSSVRSADEPEQGD